MKRLLFILNFSFVIFHFVFAQTAAKADALFGAADWVNAYSAYSSLHKQDTHNQLYTYRLARCADELGRTDEAIQLFEEAGERFTLRNYYLGNLYIQTYRFDEAITLLDKYLQTQTDTNSERYKEVMESLQKARKGQRLMKRVVDVQLLDTTIIAKQDFLSAYPLKHLQQESERIIYTNERGDHRFSYCADSANRLNICQQERLLDEWSEWTDLPAPINTEYNEIYPFLLGDGLTLYFASNRSNGMGGYDIYMSRPTETGYLTPEMLGFPFNSFANDYLLAVDEAEGLAYLVSDRALPDSLVCIYKFVWEAEDGSLPILRNVNDEELRNVAISFGNIHAEQSITPQENPSSYQPAEFRFVVNDSVIYEQLSHFPTEETAALYAQCDSLQHEIKAYENRLEELRQEYAQTEANKKKDLSIEILLLEKTIPTERKHLQAMIYKLRDVLRRENER